MVQTTLPDSEGRVGAVSPPKLNPLSDEHRQSFEAILAAEPAVRDLFERCKRCGIELGDREAHYDAAVNTARLMLENFFPKRS